MKFWNQFALSCLKNIVKDQLFRIRLLWRVIYLTWSAPLILQRNWNKACGYSQGLVGGWRAQSMFNTAKVSRKSEFSYKAIVALQKVTKLSFPKPSSSVSVIPFLTLNKHWVGYESPASRPIVGYWTVTTHFPPRNLICSQESLVVMSHFDVEALSAFTVRKSVLELYMASAGALAKLQREEMWIIITETFIV